MLLLGLAISPSVRIGSRARLPITGSGRFASPGIASAANAPAGTKVNTWSCPAGSGLSPPIPRGLELRLMNPWLSILNSPKGSA